MKKFKLGFTLAEVLIALAAIGVIAAITLPSLQDDILRRTLGTSTAKAYNTITNAIAQYLASQEVEDIADLIYDQDEFVEYFKVSSRCGGTYGTECFGTAPYRALRGNGNIDAAFTGEMGAGGSIRYLLSDGIGIQIPAATENDTLVFLVDVNGSKKPNRAGRDAWVLRASGPGVVDDITITEQQRRNGAVNRAALCADCGPDGTGMDGCFGCLLRNGFHMDY